jgi:hypothetical protein
LKFAPWGREIARSRNEPRETKTERKEGRGEKSRKARLEVELGFGFQ